MGHAQGLAASSLDEVCSKLPTDLDEGVSTVMLSTSSSASLSRPCLTGRVTTTYLQVEQCGAQLIQQPHVTKPGLDNLPLGQLDSHIQKPQLRELLPHSARVMPQDWQAPALLSSWVPSQVQCTVACMLESAYPSWRPFCARTRSSDSASGGCAEVLAALVRDSEGSDSSSNVLPADTMVRLSALRRDDTWHSDRPYHPMRGIPRSLGPGIARVLFIFGLVRVALDRFPMLCGT